MLLVRVYVDTGVVPPFDPRPYSPQWHLHRDDERYLGFLLERGIEVAEPQPGDIVVWKIGRSFAHGGIVVGWPFVVHAYQSEGRVVESDISLPSPLSENKKQRFFNPWGRP
jgi:cell wall-associated NlpC family hydrolase